MARSAGPPLADRQQHQEQATPGSADGVTSPDRGALAGTMVAGVAGFVWTQWGASGLSGAASAPIRLVGATVGLVIFLSSGRLMRSRPSITSPDVTAPPRERSTSMFSSPGYLIVVAVQVIAFGAGNQLLVRTGHPEYIITWVAAVVGAHFVALGRLFYPGFYLLGAGLTGAGVAGAAVGLAGGSSGALKATCGLIAAGTLFTVAIWTLARARAVTRT